MSIFHIHCDVIFSICVSGCMNISHTKREMYHHIEHNCHVAVSPFKFIIVNLIHDPITVI